MTELGNRQSAILMQLQTDGEVSVDALARQHGVTTQQIRRDLSVLCDAGMAARTHGGARRPVTGRKYRICRTPQYCVIAKADDRCPGGRPDSR